MSTSALRVLLVTPRYPPLTGGVETHVHEVATRLANRGVRTTVLTTDLDLSLPPVEELDGVEILRARAYPHRRDYYWSPELYRLVRSARWDVVHCQGIHTFVPVLAMLASMRSKIPFVVTFHTGGHSSRLRSRARGLQWVLLAPLLRSAFCLIAVSEFERQLFAHVPGVPAARIRVIPNGADLPSTEGETTEVDHNLVVSLGRLEKYKGHQHVVAALPLLAERYPQIRLRIIGSGPFEGQLRETAKRLMVDGRVQIGPIPSNDRRGMAKQLAEAGVVVLLSEYEAHAIAAIEPIALGRPVVVTNSTGLHDLVQAGLAHGVTMPGDPHEVANAIASELDRPTRKPGSLPTWDDTAETLLALYRTAVGQT